MSIFGSIFLLLKFINISMKNNFEPSDIGQAKVTKGKKSGMSWTDTGLEHFWTAWAQSWESVCSSEGGFDKLSPLSSGDICPCQPFYTPFFFIAEGTFFLMNQTNMVTNIKSMRNFLLPNFEDFFTFLRLIFLAPKTETRNIAARKTLITFCQLASSRGTYKGAS